MSLICEKCGGTHLQSLKMIHQSGISVSDTSGSALAVGSNGSLTSVGYTGSTTSTSRLAALYAPPKTNHVSENIKSMLMSVFFAGLIYFTEKFLRSFMLQESSTAGLNLNTSSIDPEVALGWLSSGVSIGLLLCALFFLWYLVNIPVAISRDKEARGVYAAWEHTLLCHTCGNISLMKGFRPA